MFFYKEPEPSSPSFSDSFETVNMDTSNWDISGDGTDELYTSSLTPVYTNRPALDQSVYGAYSRHLIVNGNHRTFAVKNSVANGAFTGIPDNQGVRLECTFYSLIDTMFNRDVPFSLYAYTKNCHLSGISSDVGYLIGGVAGAGFVLYLNNGANYQINVPSPVGPGIYYGQWHGVRLEIQPVGNTHVLKVYCEIAPCPDAPWLNIPLPGNNNWVAANLMHNGGNNSGITLVNGNELHIPNTSPAYAPYNAASRSGIRCDNGAPYLGGGLVDGFKIELI